MKAISIKLPEELLEPIGRCAKALHLSPEAYIRRAIERMNRQTQALLRAKRLADASKKVRKESMCVNRGFAAIETLSEDAIDIEASDKRSKKPPIHFSRS